MTLDNTSKTSEIVDYNCHLMKILAIFKVWVRQFRNRHITVAIGKA